MLKKSKWLVIGLLAVFGLVTANQRLSAIPQEPVQTEEMIEEEIVSEIYSSEKGEKKDTSLMSKAELDLNEEIKMTPFFCKQGGGAKVTIAF